MVGNWICLKEEEKQKDQRAPREAVEKGSPWASLGQGAEAGMVLVLPALSLPRATPAAPQPFPATSTRHRHEGTQMHLF